MIKATPKSDVAATSDAPSAPATEIVRASAPSSPLIEEKAEAPKPTPLEAAAATIEQAVPRLSDPELQAAADAIARSVHGRDPEASLDIPPPADVKPPEEREPNSTDPYIGTTFDHRYKIQKLLGEGGMGFVYLARHKVIDKKVAVKVLRADLAKDREILDRFLQEAKAASSIGNPHIVDISDFGDLPDGSTYFVMEFLEGQSLSQLIDSGVKLAVERICHIAQQITAGLSAAHAQGIVHRDLKPDNIFVIARGSDQDFVKILDFGIAKVTGNANTKLTKAGAVFGTPHYMSPEQAAGAPVDHRTDIYALGVILYEMVSGQLPFNADNFMGILTQHMYKAPVPIRALVPGPECPPSLEAVILKCLSKKPESRYQSMEELSADLDRVRNGQVAIAVTEMMARSGGFNVPADYFKQPAAIVPATPPAPQTKWPRYVWVAGAAAAVAIVGAIFVISGTTNGKTPPKPDTSAAATTAVAPTTTAATTAAPVPVKKTAVAVAALPDTAQVWQNGAAVHQVPWSVEVEEGKPVTIEIKAEGFETETLILDGSEVSKMIKLKAINKGPRPGVGKGGGKGPGKKGGKGGEVLDPWGK
ncbi:serine/threonine protein kinase [Minicystis rosea]|nr:serine/threonine protein kinase [Minicystis rosea]